jgi:hypothetical protein
MVSLGKVVEAVSAILNFIPGECEDQQKNK